MSYVTRESVAAAIQALQRRGERISVRSVRAELGGGSLEDIGQRLREVLMNEPAADDSPTLPALPYDLPEPDQEIVQRHLTNLEGEGQLQAMISHLWAVIGAARAVPPVIPGAMNWLHRYGQSMGEVAATHIGIGALHEHLQATVETAQHVLQRIAREYAALQAHEKGEQHGTPTASLDHQLEGRHAEPH